MLKYLFKISLIIALSLVWSCTTQKPPPPNFVFILVDDLSWSDVSYNGSTTYETPNVDHLASEGVVFTDFYTAGPVCSPSRASIMTGKYPARIGITTYLLEPERDEEFITPHLPTEEFTIAEALKDQGYATGYFGKWHLGYSKDHWADNQGFDVAIGGMDLPWAWKIAHPETVAPDVDRSKGHTRFFSPHHLTFMEDGPEGEYLTDRLTNETIKFIKDNKEHPFFAFLSFHTVHTPLQAKEDVVRKYDNKIKSMGLDTLTEANQGEKRYQNNANYAAMVHHMDENVGRVIDCLKELNLEENTVLIFTSDNGGKGSVTSNYPLKGMKHNLDEGGIRVPLIVRWTGKTKSGSVSEFPLISNDFYPTFLELAGAPLKPEQHMDGLSFGDILLDKTDKIDREAIFWHYPHSRMEGAVRKGDFKLLLNYKTGESQLYNLREDLSETTDIGSQYPKKKNEMEQLLKNWLVEVDAKFPENLK